jgi:hypothetical protein
VSNAQLPPPMPSRSYALCRTGTAASLFRKTAKEILEDHTDECIAIENAYALNQACDDSEEIGTFKQTIRTAELAIMDGKAETVWDLVIEAVCEEGVLLRTTFARMGFRVKQCVFDTIGGSAARPAVHPGDKAGDRVVGDFETTVMSGHNDVHAGKDNASCKPGNFPDVVYVVDLAEPTLMKSFTDDGSLSTSHPTRSTMMWSTMNLNGLRVRVFVLPTFTSPTTTALATMSIQQTMSKTASRVRRCWTAPPP